MNEKNPEFDPVTKRVLTSYAQQAADAERQARAVAIGKLVRFVTDFNGQPWGKSRKSLKGKAARVEGAWVEEGRVTLFSYKTIDGYEINAGFGLGDVEFIETV